MCRCDADANGPVQGFISMQQQKKHKKKKNNNTNRRQINSFKGSWSDLKEKKKNKEERHFVTSSIDHRKHLTIEFKKIKFNVYVLYNK